MDLKVVRRKKGERVIHTRERERRRMRKSDIAISSTTKLDEGGFRKRERERGRWREKRERMH